MGAFLEQEVKDNRVDYIDMHEYQKAQIVEYIRSTRTKNVNFPEDFKSTMKMIELNNTKLLPMAIELYSKLFNMFGEYKNVDGSKVGYRKKLFFIKPKFRIEQVTEKYESDMANIKVLPPFNPKLILIKDPVVGMISVDIKLDEYNDSFNNSPPKKDMIGISKRILKDMPEYLKTRLINIYNRILHDPELIAGSALAKGSYVYKVAKKGPSDDINSFRPISSLPNVVNHFHRILNIRLSNYLLANNYLDANIQKGGICGQVSPILSQYFKLKNVIKHANKTGQPCVIVFIDITNAFGSINKKVLYEILKLYQVDERFINYLSTFYETLEYYVDINDEDDAQMYKWGDGMIQGCSLSPLLFVTALNYVLKHIDEKYKEICGYKFLDNLKILLTAFIDDIAIVCNSVASAQLIFDDFGDLFRTLGLEINKEKSAIMTINEDTVPQKSLATIQKVQKFKYLGEYLTSNGDSSEPYAELLTNITGRLIRININTRLDDAQKIKAFETFILPQLQKKLLTMYDIGTTRRIKIASIIKTYLTKWGYKSSVDLFGDLIGVMSASDDEVIQGIIAENICSDDTLEQDIAITDYIFKNPGKGFGYGQVDDEFIVDAEIDALDEITDC